MHFLPHRQLFTALLLTAALGAGCSCGPSAGPAAPVATLQAAEEHMKQRQFEPALEMLKELAARPDADALVFQRLAEAYTHLEDYSKGVLVLRDGLAKHPDNGRLSYSLARLYARLQQHELACTELERARANKASERDVAMLLGSSLGQLGKLDEAVAEFERARAAGAEAGVVDYNLALIDLQRNQFARAKQRLEQALAAAPEYLEARREHARAEMLAGADVASANRALDTLMTLKDKLPKDHRVFEYMGDAWMLLGDFNAALQCYTDALRLGQNPKAVEEKYRIAALKLKERKQQAKAEAAEAAAPGKQE